MKGIYFGMNNTWAQRLANNVMFVSVATSCIERSSEYFFLCFAMFDRFLFDCVLCFILLPL